MATHSSTRAWKIPGMGKPGGLLSMGSHRVEQDWRDLATAAAVGEINMPLTPMDRPTKQKINKEIQTLNDTIDQLDLIDICRTFHPKTMNFTFILSVHGTFSRIDHILGHKSSLGKFKKIEIIPSIFSDHNAVRLDLKYRRKTIKNFNMESEQHAAE